MRRRAWGARTLTGPCRGSQWPVEPLKQVGIEDPGPRLALNDARCRVFRSAKYAGRWDYDCDREVRVESPHLHRYLETVEGLKGGVCVVNEAAASTALPAQVHLKLEGVMRYRVRGGLYGTLAEAQRTGLGASPFAHISVLNRYAREIAWSYEGSEQRRRMRSRARPISVRVSNAPCRWTARGRQTRSRSRPRRVRRGPFCATGRRNASSCRAEISRWRGERTQPSGATAGHVLFRAPVPSLTRSTTW